MARLGVTAGRLLVLLSAVIVGLLPVTTALTSAAGGSDSAFAVQVSPSPLVSTIDPGKTSTLDLQIRNSGSDTQSLQMGLRSFTVDSTTGQVNLGKTAPADVSRFVSFSEPTFRLSAGQIMTQHVLIATPASAGFTYSFAITISQANAPVGKDGKTAIKGSVAVFTLLSVDRPGATRKLSLQEFAISKHVYEYLPASITLKFKNLGNTLVQPRGTIFIQRHSDDTTPIASISVNPAGGYILPGSSRILTSTWNNGFPHYVTSNVNGQPKQQLSWQGGDISKLRFGRYVAKVVAVYNDGNRDVPLVAEVSFWVIPWRLLIVAILVVALALTGAISILRRSTKIVRHKPRKPDAKPKDSK